MPVHRVEYFVEDHKLGESLRALLKIAIRPPVSVPVVNAEVRHGKLAKTAKSDVVSMFAQYLTGLGKQKIDSTDAQAFCKKAGMVHSSYGYVLSKAKKAGLIKKNKNNTYTVLTQKKE